jgi:hypothetical protein
MKKIAFVLALALASSAASANETPKYSDVAKGTLTPAPHFKKKPKVIAPREQVPGLYVVQQKFDREVPVTQRHITVVTDPKSAEQITKGEGFGTFDDAWPCLSEASRRFDPDDPEGAITEWDSSASTQVNLWPVSKENPEGVSAVHVERFVDDGGSARLEITNAWVDPNTRGARLIDKSTLPLTLVGASVGGMRVFAARNDRADGRNMVEFVVARPRGGSEIAKRMSTLMAIRPDGNGGHAAGCSHIRVSLPIETKGGESALVFASVELPSLPRSADDDDATPENEKTEKSDSKAKPAPRKRPIRRGPVPEGSHEIEARLRDIEVHLGVSRTTKDAEPLLSVSFGWAGREQTQRTFVADPK